MSLLYVGGLSRAGKYEAVGQPAPSSSIPHKHTCKHMEVVKNNAENYISYRDVLYIYQQEEETQHNTTDYTRT